MWRLLLNFINRKLLLNLLLAFVGEFRKTRHPRNVEVNEICDGSFQWQRTHDDLESGTHEVSKSRTRDGSESSTC
jgi:hypothetical protein